EMNNRIERRRIDMVHIVRHTFALTLMALAAAFALGPSSAQQATPRKQPGADITLYAPDQHDLYDGHFVLSATRVYMVGSLNDATGWNHMANDAAHVRPVQGRVNVDVDEIKNTGTFTATLKIPEGNLTLAIDRFHEFNPCQDGGIA